MRLVFLTDIITPYMAAVQAALADRVELTVLFCAATGTRGAQWSFADGLPFRHEVIGGLAIRRRGVDATDFHLSPRVLAALRRHRPEAIVCAGWSAPTAYAAAYARSARAGLCIHSDGTPHSERHLDPLQRLARRVLLRLEPVCVANSELSARRFAELGVPDDRLFRAPHSTDIARFRAAAALRREPPAGTLRVLSVGRLIPRKGLDRLVAAVALAAQRVPGVRLELVGTGSEEEALRAQAAELGVEVAFGGFVDQAGLPEVYAGADVFAFPTLDDPFGLVVLEAAASGLPLVASPHGGATVDLVEDGRNGFVVEPDDVAGMADAFVRLAEDPALRARMGAYARESTADRTPERAADGYVAAAEAAIARVR